MKKYLLMFIAVIAAIATLASPALAQESSAPAGETVPQELRVATMGVGESPLRQISLQEYAALSPGQGREVDMAVAEAAAEASGCWEHTAWRSAYNVFNSELWRFNQRVTWCGDGTWVRETRQHTIWAQTFYLGWSLKSSHKNNSQYGAGWSAWWPRGDGHMCLAEYLNCAGNYYPWIQHRLGGNGSWSWEAG